MQTVISAFDDRQAARSAIERLVEIGFPRHDVHLQEAPVSYGDDPADTEVGRRAMDSAEREVAVDRGVLASIGHFFNSLFGKDHPAGHAETYSEVVRRGSSVVVVDAPNQEEAERAVAAMHECGAIDVDERANKWRADGWGSWITDEQFNTARGVRVFERNSQRSVRDIVHPPEGLPKDDMSFDEEAGSRHRERERAVAADLLGEPPLDTRDPDAPSSSGSRGSLDDSDKPGR
jgi:hypothetical protein